MKLQLSIHSLCVVIFFCCIYPHVSAQTDSLNLDKYHSYRARLLDKFIVVNENVMDYGVNIPASDLFTDKGILSWGDANNNMSHYLMMLASEMYLLKKNHLDYSASLRQLYYAMWALERLDMYSEANWRLKLSGVDRPDDEARAKDFAHPWDINGFMLRDDVGLSFWNKYGTHFTVPGFRGNLFRNDHLQLEEMSQDVIEHVMEGLSLVNSLTGIESVADVPCGKLNPTIKSYLVQKNILLCNSDSAQTVARVDFSLWAKDIVKRFIRHMQYDGVYEFRKKVLWFKNPMKLLSTHWVLINPVTKQPVMEGNGTDTGIALISNGLIQAAEAITGEKGLRLYKGFVGNRAYRLAFKHPRIYQLGKEDNKTRSLACHVPNDENFYILRHLRDTYNPHKTGRFPIYEHFPLMYLAIHHLAYSEMKLSEKERAFDKALYERLLNCAPVSGPATNCGVYEWTSTSRCLWPENLGKNQDAHTEFNGLDYMMLLNLYYIAFNVEGYR